MNILYIDHYAGSKTLGRSFRPYYLGQEWTKKQCQLTVVGGSYSHLRKENPTPGITYDDKICYIWLWTPKYKGNGIGRILSMLIFMIQLFVNLPKIIRIAKPNSIIASTVYMLDIFPAWCMKQLSHFLYSNKPSLIFELHDIWPMSPMQIGNISKYNPYILLLSFVEWSVYRMCDKVASILPNSFEHIKKFGVDEKQVFYVPNGINIDEWSNEELKNNASIKNHIDIIKNLKSQGKFLVGYTGAHTTANNLYYLLESARLLKLSNLHIILVGEGNEKQYLQEYAKKSQLDNVTFLEPIPKKYIPQILNLFDVLYMSLHNLSVYRYGISPNKIFDYMMSAKPIISSIESDSNPIKEAKCGFQVKSNNPKLLAEMIEQVCKQPKSLLDKMGENGKSFVIQNHSYAKIANTFLESITEKRS